ncbi:hypothetical protein QBC38DRAFT_507749 [Podospora fimiseda]|uniref:AAA+ ATPase domain-containing protein n=1 Tax=Podospora fimiseda TaxID=252190 RepID=A0AAN7GZD9_9PEZI|nr:hypothetical protein QBC38DRAFT_507749 [Podospora fimiseda]
MSAAPATPPVMADEAKELKNSTVEMVDDAQSGSEVEAEIGPSEEGSGSESDPDEISVVMPGGWYHPKFHFFYTNQGTQSDSEAETEKQDVSYHVSYLDRNRDPLGSHPSDKIIDLNEARKNALKTAVGLEADVFKVTTFITTSAKPRSYNSDRWKVSMLLADPDVSLRVDRISLKIFSQSIIQALRDIVPYYPGFNLNRGTVESNAPYCPLVHHLDGLREYTPPLQDDSDTTKKHIGLLLDYIGSIYGNLINEETERHKRGFCTYRMFWIALKPGTTVYIRSSSGRISAHVVRFVEVDRDILDQTPDGDARIKVFLWHLNLSGRKVERRMTSVNVDSFDGEVEIKQLNIFPASFLDSSDGQVTRDKLIQQGKKWYRLIGGEMVDYKGSFLSEDEREFTRRVVVDPTAYWENTRLPPPPPPPPSAPYRPHYPRLPPASNSEYRDDQDWDDLVWKEYDNIDHRNPISPKAGNSQFNTDVDLLYLLCSQILGAFILKTRTWKQIDVAFCSEAETNTKAIENLVMSSQRKDMIKALVHKHKTGDSKDTLPKIWGADFIQNKGEGQIFLLHGGPGVGKTYVKCIAEYTGRPLLSLTFGDVGTNETQMEKRLLYWFALAKKWGAVMLIDEADIYLEKRSPGDILRNGLVSVFLRWIEYYKGILFLTSNRVGHFYDAFTSRIHEYRRLIWEGFFAKLKRERPDIKVSRRAREYVLKSNEIISLNWNGREIRNAFQTAVTLAQYQFYLREEKEDDDVVELEKEHFEEVCGMTNDFKEYLNKVGGNSDEEMRAMQARNRNELDE